MSLISQIEQYYPKINKIELLPFFFETPCMFFDPSTPSMRKGDDGGGKNGGER